jgi:hypothetical protein
MFWLSAAFRMFRTGMPGTRPGMTKLEAFKAGQSSGLDVLLKAGIDQLAPQQRQRRLVVEFEIAE